MKVAKALKLKNRLAGELQKQKMLFLGCNVVEQGRNRSFDPRVILDKIKVQMDNLCLVKAAIAIANSSVVGDIALSTVRASVHFKIFRIAELKGLITVIEGLNTQDGTFVESSFQGNPITRVFQAVIVEPEKVQIISSMQKEIDDIQDEIDEANARVSLSVLDFVTID